MTRDLSKLTGSTFDLLVVGGGIVGAGIAWDASQRGLSCALVDQGDFASGTSSKTTKLIHGGFRYLENLEFKLVKESLRERSTLLANAPRLVQPLSFLIPVIKNRPRPWWMVRAGIFLYDRLSGKQLLAPHQILKTNQLSQPEAALVPQGSRNVLYQDAQMDDARLVLETVRAAAREGAIMANHVRVVRWNLKGVRICGAELEDRLSGRSLSIQARRVINATGPWADRMRHLADPALRPIVRPSKGVHLVYPDLGLHHALVLAAARDNRIFFLIPWRGLTLIGTTDTDTSQDPGTVQADRTDVDYLIEEANRILPHLKLRREKILGTFAGVRPLVAKARKDPWAVSRSHLIHEDPNGLISVVGGKFTTFRKIAEELVDRVVRDFPDRTVAPCRTAQSGLGPQRATWRSDSLDRLLQAAIREGQVHPPEVSRWVQRYGADAKRILRWIQEDSGLLEPICPHHPFIRAEIRYALEEEMAVTLSDLIFRRFQIAWSACQGRDALGAVAASMGELLHWSPDERRRQEDRCRQELDQSRAALG